MKKILEAKNIVKTYNRNTKNELEVLHGISLEVYEGDFICIMGPSGSGKSTLINNLSTIDTPTKGSVFINGKSVSKMLETETGKFRYENLGFVFQSFNLMDTLTIRENIAVPLTLAKVGKDEIKERVEAIANKLEINALLDKYPTECSGGQCQRCAVARALVTNPKLIVADEPTGNLDSKNSHDLLTLLKDLNEKDHVTIIMVTHDAMIASYSQRLLFIRDGVIDEVIEREGLDQKEYFYKIVQANSKESMELLFQ